MSKKSKREARKRDHKRRMMLAAPVMVQGARRGRPRELREIGPTQQTVEKQKPDPLHALHGARLLGKQHVEAGENVWRTWVLYTGEAGPRGDRVGSPLDDGAFLVH